MSVVELLAQLRALDVHVSLEGEKLRLNAPAGTLSDGHRELLQKHKGEIVEFLRSAQQLSAQQRAIVPLQAAGSQAPVFAVAGHNGDVFCYRQLSQHLGADQPFYGLQPAGLEEGTVPISRVEDMAAYFAAQIRAFQPAGPRVIAGFCAGGTVAFELARQLTEAGVPVSTLVLFGAPYSTSYRKLPQLVAGTTYMARRSVVHARTFIELPQSDRRRYFADRVRALRTSEPPLPDDPVLQRRGQVEEATMAAVRDYQPRPFTGHVDIMLPCDSWKSSWDAPLRWSKLAASSAQFAGPEGCNGDTMLLAEHAATFAVLFNEARERRQRS